MELGRDILDTVVVDRKRKRRDISQKPFKPFQMAVRTAIIWSPMARNAVTVARVISSLSLDDYGQDFRVVTVTSVLLHLLIFIWCRNFWPLIGITSRLVLV